MRFTYKVVNSNRCPYCGKKFKNVKLHIQQKHDILALDDLDKSILNYLSKIYPQGASVFDIIVHVAEKYRDLYKMKYRKRHRIIRGRLHRMQGLGLVEMVKWDLGWFWRLRL